MIGALTMALLLPQQGPRVATVQLAEHVDVTSAEMADTRGNGTTDLVLACYDRKTERRSLRVHGRDRKRPAFSSTATETYAIDRDVVAYTFCDCLPATGRELILLTPEQVVAVTRGAGGEAVYTRLLRHPLVWPIPDEQRLVPLPNEATDFDGDGREDLVLPKPDGWSICLQGAPGDADRFPRIRHHDLPPWQNQIQKAVQGGLVSTTGGSVQVGLQTEKPKEARGPLVDTSTRTPQCRVIDLDGNRRLDLATWRNGRLLAAIQDPAGELVQHTHELPLDDGRLKLIDPAFDVQFAAIDDRPWTDLVLTTSATRDGEVEARVDLLLTGDDGTWPDKPNVRLRLQPLALPPQLVDVDGDGDLDLVCVSVRTSAMRQLTGDKASALDAQVTMFANEDGTFRKQPMMTRTVPLAPGKSRLSKPFFVARPGRRGFPGDVLMFVGDSVERRFLTRKGERLDMADPDGRISVPDDAEIVVGDRDGNDLLIVDGNEVQHVEFRR